MSTEWVSCEQWVVSREWRVVSGEPGVFNINFPNRLQLTIHHSRLTTHRSQLTTHHSQLTIHD
ncbi:MAG TPA: hypothetical protein VKA49_04930 [Flavitalea sp.]|nr:hypothetical protein [Flavitalea sp.]